MKTPSVLLLAALGLACLVLVAKQTSATEVDLCESESKNAKSDESEADDESVSVEISGCDMPPCRLKRKTTIHAEFTFTPTEDIKTLKNEVSAKVLGIPLPFIGVDNTNACNSIYIGDEKAPCPLKANQKYTYKNKFDILEVYPKIKTVVRWALVTEKNTRPLCFSVPAKITS